jgi:histidinol phosphatase-like PHP family hydrolase
MKFIYDHDLHIHSRISSCSGDPKQTNEAILSYAKENGLKTVCLTDHYWDERVGGPSEWYAPQNTSHIKQALPLPKAEGIRFLFGCETDMRADMTVGISRERFDEFDFVIIPTTHMHMKEFTVPAECAGKADMLAALWVKKLDTLLSMELPFHKIGIAHLACYLIGGGDDALYQDTLAKIKDEDLLRIFTRAAALGVGIELNQGDFTFAHGAREDILRIFKAAKECGCKFYLGSDAHHPANFENAPKFFERAIELLGLTEDDKFII